MDKYFNFLHELAKLFFIKLFFIKLFHQIKYFVNKDEVGAKFKDQLTGDTKKYIVPIIPAEITKTSGKSFFK